jgi:hypothetical protein
MGMGGSFKNFRSESHSDCGGRRRSNSKRRIQFSRIPVFAASYLCVNPACFRLTMIKSPLVVSDLRQSQRLEMA